ncbi:hypothetical protein G5I_05409 [Acromyrmex echinatior]|uniref:Uncharacterized protein n=1 Tax=Acromyrmex echinatior TaxID=103372 RepID=F4WI87_ACREC|nr:hypothetical protein G5I_05409 [Acromyrmex echinatior]
MLKFFEEECLSRRGRQQAQSVLARGTDAEREDLLAVEYNADLSVSIHRDREPSSSRVPLRRGYTYPPSAARRGTEKTKRGGRNRGEWARTLGVFCAWPSRFCASATRAKEVAKQMAAMLVFKMQND